jgi:hypothetical protein
MNKENLNLKELNNITAGRYTKWNNGEYGRFVYCSKYDPEEGKWQGYSKYDSVLRFVETTPDFSSSVYPEREWTTKPHSSERYYRILAV